MLYSLSQALRVIGIRKYDPRLAEFMDGLKEIHRHSQYEGSPETLKLDRETFKRYVNAVRSNAGSIPHQKRFHVYCCETF